ncbi:MAG: serine/threonine-protein phosphatase [Lachnospiraceae bacterium]|nr:serine/threonine-protein phosphatase [Lachnospiraceae bacterium]
MEWHYTVAAQTDAGTTKTVNQDSLTVKVANTSRGEAVIAVLCDGMGGLEQGELASSAVVRAYEKWFLKEFPHMFKRGFSGKALEEAWRRLADEWNGKIVDYGRKRRAAMGTTLTVMLLFQGRYYILHVGDCRIYVMGNGMEQLTADQTYVAREVALGHMTPEQAANDVRRNVLLQSIGTADSINPDFLSGELYDGDTFLGCSDGFRHELAETELYEYCHTALENMDWSVEKRLENSHIMNEQLRYLIGLNKERGEKDNISAILVKAANTGHIL